MIYLHHTWLCICWGQVLGESDVTFCPLSWCESETHLFHSLLLHLPTSVTQPCLIARESRYTGRRKEPELVKTRTLFALCLCLIGRFILSLVFDLLVLEEM